MFLFCSGALVSFPDVGSGLGPLVPWSFGQVPGPLVSGPLVLRVRNPLRPLGAGRQGRGPQAVAREKLGAGLANENYDDRNRQMRGHA